MNAVRCNEFTWKEERSELNNKKVKKTMIGKKVHRVLICFWFVMKTRVRTCARAKTHLSHSIIAT